MKKTFKKIFSLVLVVCCLLSTLTVLPASAEGVDAPEPSQINAIGDNLQVTSAQDGTRVIFNRDTPGWARANAKKKYSTQGDGLEIALGDIAAVDPDYSIGVKFGNNTGWYDQPGYILVYGRSGNMSVIWMDGVNKNPNEAKVLVSDVREELKGTLAVKIVLQGTTYKLIVNDKEYSIPATYLSNNKDVNIVFGAFGDGTMEELNWDKSYERGGLAFTITRLVNNTVGEGYEELGDPISAYNAGMFGFGGGVNFYEGEAGVQVAFSNQAPDYARAGFESPFSLDEDGKRIVLREFYSADPDYSIVMKFGNNSGWYDQAGYLLVYGKSGDFAITWADGVEMSPNKGEVLATDKREGLGEELVIDIVPNGDMYDITVNGKTYSVPNTYVSNPEELYLVFGVFGDGNIKTLNYQKSFMMAAVSFVIGPETYTAEAVSVRTLKPFATYSAFMSGADKKNFKPEQALTREEAIVSLAKLTIDKKDIEGVYTTDFTDVKKSSKNHDYIAYMDRSGFLPEFGEKLKPNKEITRGEFVDMLLKLDEISESGPVTDVTAEDALYGKICYAVEKGILDLDASGKFNKDATITRGEAAKAFCVYIGKTTPISNPKTTFSDVKDSTEYAEYILLATNKIKIYEETYQATSEKSIQECINKAIELSKTKDAKVTIELTEDVYQLTEPVTIDGSTYGQYELQMVIKNVEEKSPVITGNTDLKASDFTKVEGKEYYSYQLPEATKANGSWPAFRDLYLNGERLQLAQSDDYVFVKDLRNPTYDESGEKVIAYDNWIYADAEIFKGINSDNLSTLEMCVNIDWTNRRWRISELHGIDEESGLMQISMMDEEYQDYLSGDGNKHDFTDWAYYFENHISLLDEPGEFYYDDVNGVIYFYPYKNTDMKNAVVSYPVLEKLFDMKETKNITFDGITFTGITANFASEHGFSGFQGAVHAGAALLHENIPAAAIYSDYSSRFSVYNCTFDELGGNGLYLNSGNQNVIIKGTSFTDIAMCSVIMGKHSQMWNFDDGQSNVIIDNNYIFNNGTDYPSAPALHIARIKNVAITHNTMKHTPYSGLMMGWIRTPSADITIHNAEVAYNYCEDNLFACNDGAPLYFAGANSWTDDHTTYNWVHDNYVKSTGYTGTYNGVYLDMNASNYKVYHNVLEGWDTGHGPVFNQDHMEDQYTYNNTIANNFTTVRFITTTATPDRFIVLMDNEQFATAAELPEEAHEIMDASGQKQEYKASIPVEDTEVSMHVKEPHIKIPLEGKSDEDSITFTIKNNSKEAASYSVVCTNATESSPEIITSTESLKVNAGESGEITVSFRGGDKTVRGEMLDFAVVQDNGWKMQYRRVIDIDVVGNVGEEAGSNLVLPIVIGAVILCVVVGGVVLLIIFKKKKVTSE